jgi:exosortase O
MATVGGVTTRTASNLIGALALAAAWCWLFQDLLLWLGQTLGHDDFRLNLLLLVGLGALVARRVFADPGAALDRLAAGPQLRAAPLALAALGGVGWLAVDRWLDIDILSASLFGLGTYGLVGLYLAPGAWRSGLPAALLLIGALPFGTHLDVYLGFPARVLTAEVVQQVLSVFGVAAEGAETILVIESRAANVDLPCSGIRSLWTGGLFFLAATWLERRRLGPGWLGAALAFGAALFSANLLRVLAIVVLGSVLEAEAAAQIVHAPLGVLGFVGACAFGWGLLRLLPADGAGGRAGPAPMGRPRARWQWGLVAGVVAMALLHTPRPVAASEGPEPPFALPEAMNAAAIPLDRQEADLFVRQGAGGAGKWRFRYGDVRGSILLVYSDSWRAHHPPELCYQGHGREIDGSATVLLRDDFPLRQLSLDGGEATASYWFQSADRTTDDFSSRAWAGLRADEGWVMVSVLYDSPRAPGDPEVRGLLEAVHAAVGARLMSDA